MSWKKGGQLPINDFSTDTIRAEGNRLVIDVPILDDPYRKISITCRETRQWKLLNFGCEFT